MDRSSADGSSHAAAGSLRNPPWGALGVLAAALGLGACSPASEAGAASGGDGGGTGGLLPGTGAAPAATGGTGGSIHPASGGASAGGSGGTTGGTSGTGAAPGGSGGSGGGVSGTGGAGSGEPRTRVIGYLPNWYGSYSSWAMQVDFSKVTHINLAFALGNEDGTLGLANPNDIDTFVTAAHAAGVKVFPSLCGGGGDPTITPHYEPGQVDGFVANIVDFALEHSFDGIDVDVEAPDKMGQKYDTFIAKLKAAAAPHGLEVTAAVAPWMQWGMSDETVRSFDFITIMSYDNCGTWTDACEHSSYQQAVSALKQYEDRGVSRDKIVLGVPFYGYCWGNCNGQSSRYVLYKDIVGTRSDAEQMDWFTQDGATYSYNGVATMAEKASLGKTYGGIMIWELAGDLDSSSEKSLLRALDQAL